MIRLILLMILALAINIDISMAQDDFQFNFDDNFNEEEQIDDEIYETNKLVQEGINKNHDPKDPFEKFNRQIFAFNDFLDQKISEPVIKNYRNYIPKFLRRNLDNFVNNLSAPLSFVNSLLQLNGENAMASFSSFLINSTVGIFGIFDAAGAHNIHFNEEDFGQTMAKYGLPSGPYLMLPIIGPSNVRDFSGIAIEKAVDPIAFNVAKIGNKSDIINDTSAIAISVAKVVSTRDALYDIINDIRDNSFDPYTTIKSAYIQRREALIKE